MQLSSLAVAAFVAALLVGCAAPVRTPPPPLSEEARLALIEDGRLVAQQDCSSCHAVGRDDVSPRAGAPPLRQVLESYDSGALAANLMEGIRIAHEGMPVFHISPRGVDALVEYLQYLDEESP